MSTSFRAWIFTAFYFGVLFFLAVVCFFLRELPEVRTWAPVVLVAFAILVQVSPIRAGVNR